MTNMVEKVARAIAEGCNLDPDAISPKAAAAGHQIPEWHFFVPAAHKAIRAMREPTADMLKVWQAMIDAALSPPQSEQGG